MEEIYVVYWSQTGNTQMMADAVGKGITEAGKEAAVLTVAQASLEELKQANAFAMGCPSMGVEVLEEDEMEPFVGEVEKFVKGKTVALFGSYGWGNGEWMDDWVSRMERAGATVLRGAGLICQETPDGDTLADCEALGKELASL